MNINKVLGLLTLLLLIIFAVVANLTAISNTETGYIAHPLIYIFKNLYGIKLEEYNRKEIQQYKSLNDFFTREISPRQIQDGLVSPVDGKILQQGVINENTIVQAKGKSYSVSKLLQDDNVNLSNGQFCTIYLAPYNYHRVHLPLDGTLIEIKEIKGNALPVNKLSVNNVNGLYSTNERVVLKYMTDEGSIFYVILVGALFVNSISVEKEMKRYSKGEQIGKFNFGSTVILLFDSTFNNNLKNNETIIRMGETLIV